MWHPARTTNMIMMQYENKFMKTKKNNRIKYAAILAVFTISISLMVFAVPSLAATDATEDLLTLLNNVHTMQADFSQTMLNAAGKKALPNQTKQASVGKMALQRPGKFRWETLGPIHQVVIANGRYVWVYDKDLAQATKQAVDYSQAGNPAQLLSGSGQVLRENFRVQRLNSTNTETQNDYFELQPKVKNNLYHSIRLMFMDKILKSMTMEDNLGQRSQFEFANVKINTALSPSLFIFSPPHGVDVIDNM